MSRVLSPLFGKPAAVADSNPSSALCLSDWLVGSDPVIVCAERALSCLPLEALPWLASARAVARDISVSVLGHRLAVCAGIRSHAASSTSPPPSTAAPAVVAPAATTATTTVANSPATDPSCGLLPWHERPYVPVAVHAAASCVVHAIDPLMDDDAAAVLQSAAQRGAGAAPRRTAAQLLREAQAVAAVATTPDPAFPGKGSKAGSNKVSGVASGTSPRRLSNAGGATASSTFPAAGDLGVQRSQHDSLFALFEEVPATLSPRSLPSNQVLSALGAWLSPKSGLRADGHVPSPAAWQQLLRSCNVRANASSTGPASGSDLIGGAAVINVCGRLFAGVLQPQHIAGLLLPGCRAALIIDGAHTESSARREVRLEAAAASAAALLSSSSTGGDGCGRVEGDGKPSAGVGPWDVADPWVVAALFALCGVGTTVHTQWPSSHVSNELLLSCGVLRGAATGLPPLSLAEAVRSVFVHNAHPLPATVPSSVHSVPAAASAASSTAAPGHGPRKSVDAAESGADAAAAAAAAAAAFAHVESTDNSYQAGSRPVGSRHLKDRVRFNPVIYGIPHTAMFPL
jgi:hypothetical protein